MKESSKNTISFSAYKNTPPSITAASSTNSHAVRDLAVATLMGKNAHDIVVIDLAGKSDIADYMVVASGNNLRHVSALADYVEDALKKVGIQPLRKEGEGGSEWVLIDNPLVVVHIFEPEARAVYSLEKMWAVEFN